MFKVNICIFMKYSFRFIKHPLYAPTANDRILASRMGIAAVQALLEDQRNIMVGVKNGEIDYVPLTKAIKEKKDIKDDKWAALQVLSI